MARPHDTAARRSTPMTDARRTGTDGRSSLVLMLLVVLRSSCVQSAAPACGAVGAGAALSAGRHTHRRERGLLHTPDFTPGGLLGGATETDIGDAFSTRRIGLLGRACRLHRQLLSTRGNGGCSGCRSLFQYPPRPPPCEPHANWAFAKALVGRASVTRTSYPRDLTRGTAPGVTTTRSPTLWPWHCRHPRRTRPRSSPARRPASGRRSPGSWRDAATGLTLVARREDRLKALADELAQAHSVRAEVIAADLTDADSRGELPAQLASRRPDRRHPRQQRRLHDDGPRLQGRPRRRARPGAHECRSGRRPLRPVRARAWSRGTAARC